MKTCIVTYTHGDEHPPEEWKKYSSIIGNPRAKDAGVRFVQTDLNRSFGVANPRSYEEKRAKELQKEIQEYDLVLDIYRTDSPSTPFIAIIANKDHYSYTLPFGPNAVLYIPNATFSLIGNAPIGVALEYPKTYSRSSKKPPLFEVVDFVKRETYWRDMNAINTIKKGDEILYPFLSGASSYNGKCFIAKKLSDPR